MNSQRIHQRDAALKMRLRWAIQDLWEVRLRLGAIMFLAGCIASTMGFHMYLDHRNWVAAGGFLLSGVILLIMGTIALLEWYGEGRD